MKISVLILSWLFSFSSWAEEKFVPEQCNPPSQTTFPGLRPPIEDTSDAECASNTTEMRTLLPGTVERIYRLEGSWSDLNFRKSVRPLPKAKQYKDKKGALIVNEIDRTTVTYRFNANKKGIWIQEESTDKNGDRKISSEMPLKVCRKGNDMFLRISDVAEIPVFFPGKRCMLIGSQGKWWRFWRYMDIHTAFAKSTETPTQIEAAVKEMETLTPDQWSVPDPSLKNQGTK